MSLLEISDTDIPLLPDKVAIITGGAAGIGFATTKILASRGVKTYMLDLNPPEEGIPENAEYISCNITSWFELQAVFTRVKRVDITIANAGVSEETNYFKEPFDDSENLIEHKYAVLDVNLRAVLNLVKLSLSTFRRQGTGGSIVITSSATAFVPELSMPVYSATKLALVGLVCGLRPTVTLNDVTINCVTPAATVTRLLSQNLADYIVVAGLPVSSPHTVGLAIAYSVVAREARQAEPYGKDNGLSGDGPGRWNGRTILVLGETYTELEEPISKVREGWFGKENTRLTKMQQAAMNIQLNQHTYRWSRGKTSVALARKLFIQYSKSMLLEGYQKYKGGFFYVPFAVGERLMIPTRYLEELKSAPMDKLDFVATFQEMFEGKYTGFGSRAPLHPRVIKAQLNHHLADVMPSLDEEVKDAFADLFPPAEDWTEIARSDLFTKIIAHASSRVFGGTMLSRDEDWHYAMTSSWMVSPPLKSSRISPAL